jgi:hypothetical protein
MSSRRRFALVLVGAFAFGLVAAWAKGQDTDGVSTISQLRSTLGNLSTPWLLVAFIAGTQSPRLRSGALLGLLATMVALVGFYVLTTLVVDLGGHGFLDDFRKELSANRAYLEGGLVTGPLFGALGAWWRQTRSLRSSVLAGALMMAEPLVLVLVGLVFSGGVLPSVGGLPLVVRILPGWELSADRSAISIAVYAAEFGLGLAVVLLAVLRPPKRQWASAPSA